MMKTALLVIMLCCVIVLPVSALLYPKIIYKDETYIVYKKGKLYWMTIGDTTKAKGPPVMYLPTSLDFKTWRKITKLEKGVFSVDVFYLDLPPPFSLLLPGDMLYINSIVYYPKSHVSRVYFNGKPYYFLNALLDRVKNV